MDSVGSGFGEPASVILRFTGFPGNVPVCGSPPKGTNLEGQGDLVSKFITPIGYRIVPLMLLRNLFTERQALKPKP